MTTAEFIESLKKSLDRHIQKRNLDAWFFNDWSEDNICRKNGSINKYLNSHIPGRWKITHVWGNGTNIGMGEFKNEEYGLNLTLECWDENEEYIDTYEIQKI